MWPTNSLRFLWRRRLKAQLVWKSVRCSESTPVLLQCTTCFLCRLIKTCHFPSLYLRHIPKPYLYSTLSLLEERVGINWENQSNENFCLTVIHVVCHNLNQISCFTLLTYWTFTYLIIRHDMFWLLTSITSAAQARGVGSACVVRIMFSAALLFVSGTEA